MLTLPVAAIALPYVTVHVKKDSTHSNAFFNKCCDVKEALVTAVLIFELIIKFKLNRSGRRASGPYAQLTIATSSAAPLGTSGSISKCSFNLILSDQFES